MNNSSEASIAQCITETGLAHFSGSLFLQKMGNEGLKALQASYFTLPVDEYGGNRYRAYQKIVVDNHIVYAAENLGYSQSLEYNQDAGGKVRVLPPIPSVVVGSRAFRDILLTDITIAQQCGIVSFEKAIRVGVHSVRYQPDTTSVSYSSPPGPHKDEEPLVFIHLVNESSNVVGGANTIGCSPRKFNRVIKLENPMETLCVTHRQFHSVTPTGIRGEGLGYRDILLVTFQEETEAYEGPVLFHLS